MLEDGQEVAVGPTHGVTDQELGADALQVEVDAAEDTPQGFRVLQLRVTPLYKHLEFLSG